VILTEEGRCALRVDHVDGIVAFDEEEIDEKSAMLEDKNDDMMSGIGRHGDELTVLLDPAHLVPKQVRAKLAA
jgi:chemotaxis signal transduction protein